MLRISNLHVKYGPIPALRGLDMQVNAGEIVALIGANGAGKSTTLKAISGLVSSSGGAIALKGARSPGFRRNSGSNSALFMSRKAGGFFRGLTVDENLQVGAYPTRARAGERQARDRVYSLFPRLAERRRQTGGSLSGGEQQMLAFGRAMMAQPVLSVAG